ncbi:DUF2268 domain-containing putative Zn-dependent protease [Sediminibacterium sp.]|uniref:DUF2268 domain-containing putative Zn-dependent protease n=1 Tax=Sediminibacterium sp. TaxID=1917865 RepID=UPI0025D1E80A|nr:DUF2268 domain-containing putative Zn-dependent protease [Sediminibacterium sp.]
MMIRVVGCLLFSFLFVCGVRAQTVFHTSDIEHFFQAFDSVQSTSNKERQIGFVQQLYIDRGGVGIQYALNNSVEGGKPASAKYWVDYIQNNKDYLNRIRPYFANLPAQMKILEPKFKYFKEQYPSFKDGNVYFVIGLGMFGGRPEGTNLFIGCEVMANDRPDWAVSIVLHEYVHTLQKKSFNALLAHSLNEGAADFVAELINQKKLTESYPNGYISFGEKNEQAVWSAFKKFIASNQKGVFYDWLYGMKGRNLNGTQMRDLGYYMGYKICKAYYEKAIDKKQAIKEIIELDVSDDEKARTFLIQSGYADKTDRKFIQAFKFEKIVPPNSGIKLIQYGHRLEKDEVVFHFELPKGMNENEVESVTIAGSFNAWNPKNTSHVMSKIGNGKYAFRMPVKELKEKYYEYKFVINGDNWQAVPEFAKNSQNRNLTLVLGNSNSR